jgi:hypothetical protein
MTSGNLTCLPSLPEDWVAPVPKVHKEEPVFIEVNNPGNWSQFTYRAKFDSKGQYKHPTILTGVVPLPLKDGKQKLGDWELHYDWEFHCEGWEFPNNCFRKQHVTRDNMFPEEQKGCFNVENLKVFGLTKVQMKDCDALFFYQLMAASYCTIQIEVE